MNSSEFTAEAVTERMRSSLKNPASKTEGSFAMDSIQAVAQEISRTVMMRIVDFIDLTMLDTAVDEFLDRRGEDYGLKRNPATPAVGYALFKRQQKDTIIPKGLTILSDTNSYTTDYEAVIPSSGSVSIAVTCTLAGTAGNILTGAITGIRSTETIDGVTVTNEEPFEARN